MATRRKTAVRTTTASPRRPPAPSKSRLAAMIAEATVDAYDESEQVSGWYSIMEDEILTPFKTTVLGLQVTVESITLTNENELVAVCVHSRHRQRISLFDLPLPVPPPAGAEWIEAYRHWCKGH